MFQQFFNLIYTKINVLFWNGNTSLSLINQLPDGDKKLNIIGHSAQLITDATESIAEVENASVSVNVFETINSENETECITASCGTDSKQERKGLYVRQWKDGSVDVMLLAPTYESIQSAQDDDSIKVGSLYKCDGAFRFKE